MTTSTKTSSYQQEKREWDQTSAELKAVFEDISRRAKALQQKNAVR